MWRRHSCLPGRDSSRPFLPRAKTSAEMSLGAADTSVCATWLGKAYMPVETLFDRADRLGLRVPTSCNRQGTCHECIVDVTRGMDALVPRTEAESFLRENYRLSC